MALAACDNLRRRHQRIVVVFGIVFVGNILASEASAVDVLSDWRTNLASGIIGTIAKTRKTQVFAITLATRITVIMTSAVKDVVNRLATMVTR
jgi:hypothetical protein